MAAGDRIYKLRLLVAELLPHVRHDRRCARLDRETEGARCNCGAHELWKRARKLGVTQTPTKD